MIFPYPPITSGLVALLLVGAVMWPPKVPYVTRKGTTIYESIWFWRIPAYFDHPAWRIRWTWRDGLKARAYCYDPEASARYREQNGITD